MLAVMLIQIWPHFRVEIAVLELLIEFNCRHSRESGLRWQDCQREHRRWPAG
jgi:hypothetical protein